MSIHTNKCLDSLFLLIGSSYLLIALCSFGLLNRVALSVYYDTCSITDAALSFESLDEHKVNPRLTASANFEKGALLSVYSSFNKSSVERRWKCQLSSHENYCLKHGYKCYIITDTLNWKKEREQDNIHGNWIKIQVLRELLYLHPWILYLDTDSVIDNVNDLPSIEELLLEHDRIHSTMIHSLFLQRSLGWNSDLIFLRNTDWSHKFIDHIWNLRLICPDCNREQGAIHLALFDAMINHAYYHVQKGDLSDMIRVTKDERFIRRYVPHTPSTDLRPHVTDVNCCLPRLHCEYPLGRNSEKNLKFSNSAQGCVWHWQVSLGFHSNKLKIEYPPTSSEEEPTSSAPPTPKLHHPYISWDIDFRIELNISHPVKHLSC